MALVPCRKGDQKHACFVVVPQQPRRIKPSGSALMPAAGEYIGANVPTGMWRHLPELDRCCNTAPQ